MPQLIKTNGVSPDTWQLLEADAAPNDAALVRDNTLLPLQSYLDLASELKERAVGVWLASDEDVYALQALIEQVPVVACRFASFMDGRGFSQARILREHLDYEGEIRACGYFIQDQLFYLHRCGFDAFVVEDDADIESMVESLRDFSDSYQAACDNPAPLFRRRA